jgi:hypothetical protein
MLKKKEEMRSQHEIRNKYGRLFTPLSPDIAQLSRAPGCLRLYLLYNLLFSINQTAQTFL